MANQYVNKLVKDGVTKLDLTSDTVTPETLAEGVTAHNASGAQIVGVAKISSWKQLQQKVRNNDMSDISISDQYSCNKGENTLDFDVIGKNQDTPALKIYTNTLTLRTHYQLPDTMQFDAPEAFYYASGGLTAGRTYNVWYTTAKKYYQFTLTKNVPKGGQLLFVDKSLSSVASYSDAYSKTPIETVAVSIGGGTGYSLGSLNEETVNSNCNAYSRAICGYSNWKESAIRQWLNSNKPAGEWWQPQNNWDRPPIYADTMNGFLFDLDPDFLDVIGLSSKITAVNKFKSAVKPDITEDLFFLLSVTEVYGGRAVEGIDEGQPYTFYSENSKLSAPGMGVDSNRITYKDGSASFYRLRSPYQTQAGVSYNVSAVGSIGYHSASDTNSMGIVPACNII